MKDIIKHLKKEKNKECETCGCQRYDWCKGYNKALEDLEAKVKKLIIPDVVGSFITADDEGKYFIVNTDQLDEIEKGSVVYLLNTYPEDIHLFINKNGDEVWIDADDVDRKQ